ncbi:MAG: hypothetical protein BWY10_02620 [Chloroflexi bacterium ADurb.Bin180]|nr:MAG: hypothetical protein BWY10_02620 [Chloroflexi bacterium ADurb.Bin180]
MLCQKLEYPLQGRLNLRHCFAPGQQGLVAILSHAFRLYLKDAHNLSTYCLGYGVLLGIVTTQCLPQVTADLLFSMKQALVMLCFGKHQGDDWTVVAAQIGDDHLRAIAFGPQRQQKGMGTLLCVVRVDGDVQQVVGVDIDGQVNVHPASPFAFRFVVFRHQDVLLVHADHPTGAH